MPFQPLANVLPNVPTILIVGPAGSAKTTTMLRMRWPGRRTAIIDIDKNLAGPKMVLTELEKRDISHIDFAHVDKLEDTVAPDGSIKPGEAVPPLMQYLRLAALLKHVKEAKQPNGEPLYGVLGITSTTTLTNVMANEVRRQANKQLDYQFQIQDWGKFGYLWSWFINDVLRAMHTINVLDGHLETEKGEIDQILRYVLAIPGRTGNLLPMQMTDVWLASVDTRMEGNALKTKYLLRTVQDARNPNMKTSLNLPREFEASQEMIDSIVKQIVGQQPTVAA